MEQLLRAVGVDHLARALGVDSTCLAIAVAVGLIGFVAGLYIGLDK